MKKLYIFFCILVLSTEAKNAGAQISGFVFRDINANGVRETISPSEPGEFGVEVRAYNAANSLLGTVYTDASGNYSFTAAQASSGTAIRLEFYTSPETYPSRKVNPKNTNVQFVTAGPSAVNIDYAVTSKQLSAGAPNPYVATTAYTNGDPNQNGGANNAGNYDNFIIFPYDLTSDGGASRRTKNKYTGSVFGLAWQKESRILLSAAYLKRHSGFGPGGIGAIYKTQVLANGIPGNPQLMVNVSSIGINVGTDPRSTTLPSDATAPNTDQGVFSEVGKRGIGGIELSPDGRELYMINMHERKLHRINVGNPLKSAITAADVTGTWPIPNPGISGTQWFPMAIEFYQNKYYIGGVATKETSGQHDIADTANMRAVVYEFNPAGNTFTEVLRFPLSHRKGYSNNDYRYEYRNNYWCAWQKDGDISYGGPLRNGIIYNPAVAAASWATGIYYPQPMFSAIEFDVDGSMIIGIRDRFGDQGGYANYFETGNVSGETYRTLSSGEILRAGKSGSKWYIERAGSVTTNGTTSTTPGVADNNPALSGAFLSVTGTPWGGSYGPGGGYYYYNHNFSLTGVPAPFNSVGTNTAHYTKSNGGVAYLPGYNEVLSTAIDPTNVSYTNGVLKNVNLGAQAGNMSARLQLLSNPSNDPASMGKAAALGDLEMLTDAIAVEIGNLVWYDKNTNGRQDADEPGIAAVNVDLRSPGTDNVYNTIDDQVWTVTTDANGNYFFDATIVNDLRRPLTWIGVSPSNSGILPGFEYKLEIDNLQPALTSRWLTLYDITADNIDNDGNYEGLKIVYKINPGGTTVAGSNFQNNYNIDFGFAAFKVLPLQWISFTAKANSDAVRLDWKVAYQDDVNNYDVEFSKDGISFNSIIDVPVQPAETYSALHVYAPTGTNYYRIKAKGNNGSVSYSPVQKIILSGDIKGLNAYPNPASDLLKLSLPANMVNKPLNISLLTMDGKLIMVQKSAYAEKEEMLDVSALPNGKYIIRLKNEKEFACKTVQVIH